MGDILRGEKETPRVHLQHEGSNDTSTGQQERGGSDREWTDDSASFVEQESVIHHTSPGTNAAEKQKCLSVEGDPTGFGKFRVVLQSLLTRSQSETLATWFGYPPAKIDRIKSSGNPSALLVQFMDERREISHTDISRLIDALESQTISLHGVAEKVKEAFNGTLLNISTQTVTLNDKKLLLQKQLKYFYKNLCSKIRPAPFLHEQYNINRIFVEGGIEFLASDDVWQTLSSYKEIFENEKVQSKRRIIQGEPGFGKSTLALQMTNDWVNCDDTSPMKDVEVLLLLRLRHCRDARSFYSEVKTLLLPKDSTLTDLDLQNILSTSARVVIILDEYDEFPAKGNSGNDIDDIIRGKMFLDFEVILMTRTSCQPQDLSHDTTRIRLTGFDNCARKTYIQNVVALVGTTSTEKIQNFFHENQTSDLCKVPLLFCMISHMADKIERFRNLSNIAELLRHVIECFHVHEQIKGTGDTMDKHGKRSKDHVALDKAAFEGLITKRNYWHKECFRQNIGANLYDVYVKIGMLVEEEVYNYEAIGYITEVRFCHKMFLEWFAAHFLVQQALTHEAARELRLETLQKSERMQQRATSQNKVHFVESLSPRDVDYMYRFACALNVEAGRKVLLHLALTHSLRHTLLCITEWGGTLESIEEILRRICGDSIIISGSDSKRFQECAMECLTFLSEKEIKITCLELENCLDLDSLSTGRLRFESGVSLPVFDTLSLIILSEFAVVISKEEMEGILQYAARCKNLSHLTFGHCLLPMYIDSSETISVLRSKKISVEWDSGIMDERLMGFGSTFSIFYKLNLETLTWMKEGLRREMLTPYEYSFMVGTIYPIRKRGGGNRVANSQQSQEMSNSHSSHDVGGATASPEI